MNSFNILCKEKFQKALEASREHYDKTFQDCIMRLVSYSLWPTCDRVNLVSDYGEHCFYFEVKREDGTTSMNGGLIFHGWPEKGYVENGSVQLSPSYGWSIHT